MPRGGVLWLSKNALQVGDGGAVGRSSGLASLSQATPVVAKARPLPGDDGVRLDEEQVLAPANRLQDRSQTTS